MTPFLRTLAYGLLSGAMLSASRAPTGLDLTQVPAVQSGTAMLFRAAPLLAIGLFLDPERRAFRRGVGIGTLLLGATLGYGLHGLFVASVWEPSSRLGFGLLLIAFTIGLFVTSGRRQTLDEDVEQELSTPLSLIERVGLVVLGTGTAIALENLARHLRLLGMGLPEDDTVMGLVFLALAFFGAVAFGRLLSGSKLRRPLLGAGLTLAALGTWVGLDFLEGMQREPLLRYLGRVDSDLTQIGMLEPTALLSAASLIVCAFLLGAGLYGARHPRRLTSVLGGGALGLLFFPHLVRLQMEPLSLGEALETPWAWQLFALGTATAAVGGIFSLFGGTIVRRARAIGVALSVVAAIATVAIPKPRVWLFSPWYRTDVEPVLVLQTPAGMMTVEYDTTGTGVVTLDRRRLTPLAEEERADQVRLRTAWELIPSEKRSGAPRVLVVGQMTPARAFALAELGELRLERTAPWFSAMETIEAALFDSAAEVPGEALAPAAARRRIADDVYDLVLVWPTHGPVVYPKSANFLPWGAAPEPVAAGLGLPSDSKTVAVVWVDAKTPIARRALPSQAVLALDGLRSPALGIVLGPATEETLLPTGEPLARPSGFELLRLRPERRNESMRSLLFERLREATAGTNDENLLRGLHLHFENQRPSSPFETLAQQTELEEEELRAFFEASKAGPPGPLLRGVWEGVAELLVKKRMIDKILVYVEPVTEVYGPWALLDRAVAHAYEEFDEPAEALASLQRVLEQDPNDIELLRRAAYWAARNKDFDTAVELARRAKGFQPDRYDLQKELGIWLTRAGDPEGTRILQGLFEEHPEDEELLEYLKAGPLPELPEGFLPDRGRAEDSSGGHGHE